MAILFLILSVSSAAGMILVLDKIHGEHNNQAIYFLRSKLRSPI